MAGLLNNNIQLIKKFQKLFKNKNKKYIIENLKHWEIVKKILINNYKNNIYNFPYLNFFLKKKLIISNKLKLSINDCEKLSLKIDSYKLVFINGKFISYLSDINIGKWKIKIYKELSKKNIQNSIKSEFFLHLIESLNSEITKIELPIGKIEKRILYLLHITNGVKNKKKLNTIQYRHHFDIGEKSHGEILEHFVSIDSNEHFTAARTSIIVKKNSNLIYTKINTENYKSHHFSHNDINVDKNSVVNSNLFIFDSKTIHNKTSILLNGKKSKITTNTLLIQTGKHYNNINTYIKHNKKYCVSRQLNKIISCNEGKNIFNGLIKVSKDALKTDAVLISKNLIINPLSEINIKPKLEIYTDNVKCNHGVTIDNINQDQLFYLRSRGIDKTIAEQIIIHAFANEIIYLINNSQIRFNILNYIFNILQKI